MITNDNFNSVQHTAKIAGWLYLSLIPLGLLGIIYVPASLIVAGDVASTITNILEHELLFRLGIVSAFLVQLVNIFVVYYLYKLLKPVNKTHALLMAVFLLLAVPITLVNELFNFAVLDLLNSAEPSHQLVSLFLKLHQHGIFVAQIFWGLWLLPMGYLVFKSGFLPKFIGILLMLGGAGYLVDCVTHFLLSDIGFTLSEFTFVGELLLPLWLVVKGVGAKS